MVGSPLSKLRYALVGLISFVCGSYIGYFWRESIALSSANGLKLRHSSRHSLTANDLKAIDDVSDYTKPPSKLLGSSGRCAQYNVMFLKTHKTASSAIQNVLLRYAERNNLTVGLAGNPNDIRFEYGKKFRASSVARTQAPINILCHHMVFDYDEVQKVLPMNTSYITILREPGALFESMFDYMHYDTRPFARIPKKPGALEFWLNHTEKFFNGKKDRMFWWFAKNAMFFDLGYDNLREDDEYIENSIRELEKHFDLILIADYFEESLLLLKDKLCWSFSDIIALKTNARSSQLIPLNEGLVKKIRSWNKADAAIYDYFNKTFWEKVKTYGFERMQTDLQLLQKMKAEVYETCIDGGAVSNEFIRDIKNKVYNPKGVVMKGYNLKESAKKNKTCVNLLKAEIQWTNELRAKNGMPQVHV